MQHLQPAAHDETMAKKKRHTPRGKAKSAAKTNHPFDAVGNKRKRPVALNPVSYTHLTLPTSNGV